MTERDIMASITANPIGQARILLPPVVCGEIRVLFTLFVFCCL